MGHCLVEVVIVISFLAANPFERPLGTCSSVDQRWVGGFLIRKPPLYLWLILFLGTHFRSLRFEGPWSALRRTGLTVRISSPTQVYRVKEKKEGAQPTASLEKAKANAAVQIGDVKVVVQDSGKRLMVFGKSASSPIQKSAMANDHVASSSSAANKYHQPRWCPPRLTHTQKQKLQRLRNKEKREQEAEKLRDEHFNKYRPMVPGGKVWQIKAVDQPTVGPV